jgi:hypothetical protein
MPGYNHYSDCTCGWCDKSGFRFDRTRWKSFYDEYQAKSFLARNGASLGRAACFVNPNAHCPECGADVFYYQNEFGSRVFFDDLGPPWPKHPCTDRSPLPKEKSKAKPVITLRARGLVQELTAAASAVGLYEGQRIYDGISREWTLIEIQSISRKGFYNFVSARFLETLDEQQTYFSFNSANEMISVGDIVSIRENELSVWDSGKGRPRSYKVEFHSDDQLSSNSKLVAGQN